MESATTAGRAQSTRSAPSGPTASTVGQGLHVESTLPCPPLRRHPLRRRRRFSRMEAQDCRAPTRARTVTARTTLRSTATTTTQIRTTASVMMAALGRSSRAALWAPIAPTADNVRLLRRHPRHCHRHHLHRRRRHRRRHRHRRRRGRSQTVPESVQPVSNGMRSSPMRWWVANAGSLLKMD
jgi:hypothetical protein